MRAQPQIDTDSQLLFVRHLPEQRHAAVHATALRGGVGQTSGEETAGHATVVERRYAAMARVATHGRQWIPIAVQAGPGCREWIRSTGLAPLLDGRVVPGEHVIW